MKYRWLNSMIRYQCMPHYVNKSPGGTKRIILRAHPSILLLSFVPITVCKTIQHVHFFF